MKRMFLFGLMVVSMSVPGYAQNTAVIAGGPHDLSTGSAVQNNNTSINGQTCVFCHVPHSGSTNQPLWNRQTPTTTYQVYTSSTSASVATSAAISSGLSGACLSCHDGSIAMDVVSDVNGLPLGTGQKGGVVSFTAGPNRKATYSNGTGTGTGNVMSGGNPFMGADLRNDHPVAVVYQTAMQQNTPTQYAAIQTVGANIYIDGGANGKLPLFGANASSATVECSSCHDSHNNSVGGKGGFLRVDNQNSKMCLTCHKK